MLLSKGAALVHTTRQTCQIQRGVKGKQRGAYVTKRSLFSSSPINVNVKPAQTPRLIDSWAKFRCEVKLRFFYATLDLTPIPHTTLHFCCPTYIHFADGYRSLIWCNLPAEAPEESMRTCTLKLFPTLIYITLLAFWHVTDTPGEYSCHVGVTAFPIKVNG